MVEVYQSYDKNVEISGKIISDFLNAFSNYLQSQAQAIMENYGIGKPDQTKWYPQQKWLDALKEISEKFGDEIVYETAKEMQSKHEYPEHINSLELALMYLNMYYHENHQGGEIGNYILLGYDSENRKASLECITPYPDSFNRAIITALAQNFKPEGAVTIYVRENQLLPQRGTGGAQTTFNILWKTLEGGLF